MKARFLATSVLITLLSSTDTAQLCAGTYKCNSNGGSSGTLTCTPGANGNWLLVLKTTNADGVEVEVGRCEMKEDAGPAGKNRYTAVVNTGTSFTTIDATTAPNCAGVMADGNTGGLVHQ